MNTIVPIRRDTRRQRKNLQQAKFRQKKTREKSFIITNLNSPKTNCFTQEYLKLVSQFQIRSLPRKQSHFEGFPRLNTNLDQEEKKQIMHISIDHPTLKSSKKYCSLEKRKHHCLLPSRYSPFKGNNNSSILRELRLIELNHDETELAFSFTLETPQQQQKNNLSNHLSVLVNIRAQLILLEDATSSSKVKLLEKKIAKALKQYLIDDRGNLDFQELFTYKDELIYWRKVLLLERMIVIAVADLTITSSLPLMVNECRIILDSVLDFQLAMLRQMKCAQIVVAGLWQFPQKLSFASKIKFIFQNLPNIFRYNYQLLLSLKKLVGRAPRLSTNRTFYDALTNYACFLTDTASQNNHYNKTTEELYSTLITCPAPYLLKSSQKHYTILLDLDETLLHTKVLNNKVYPSLRPYCLEFLQKLSNLNCQLVIFTSSLESYARQVSSKIQNFFDGYLFRQHTIRLHDGFVKDIQRVGREMSKTLLIDDIEDNFRLHPNNGIRIKPWKDNPNDQELKKLAQLLGSLISEQPQDIRPAIPLLRKRLVDYQRAQL